MNYYLKLDQERERYSRMVGSLFEDPRGLMLPRIISACQDIFVDELKLESDIARNDALKENVWMTSLCIELKIPLFIGKRYVKLDWCR